MIAEIQPLTKEENSKSHDKSSTHNSENNSNVSILLKKICLLFKNNCIELNNKYLE